MSTSVVHTVMGCTHTPLFRAVFPMEWGFWQGRGSLVVPRGMSFTHLVLFLSCSVLINFVKGILDVLVGGNMYDKKNLLFIFTYLLIFGYLAIVFGVTGCYYLVKGLG